MSAQIFQSFLGSAPFFQGHPEYRCELRKADWREKSERKKADDILAISLEAKQYVIIGNVLNPKLKVRVRSM